jgi:hypothetical protein
VKTESCLKGRLSLQTVSSIKPDSRLKAHQASKGRLLPKNREKP